ncbi:MAG: HD domain-containing protein [Chloroherpetonaceae bacterium]|nr:HD domain-containing protein [Chloroherpetonaceae bacterium]
MSLPMFLFSADGGYIRIPVWGHIPLDHALRKVISHPVFLRLKGIRQLSFAHHVFPGATHTRFEHSLGVYHLTKLILQRLVTNPLTASLQTPSFCFDDTACRLILAASLLHDIGHYPHAHIVEKQPLTSQNDIVFDDHQDLTETFVQQSHSQFGRLYDILADDWQLNPKEVIEMVTGRQPHKFAKLISGTLDPDKMDYLMRDAHHCNIPYGSIDIERLIESFVPDAERRRFAITEKGIAPLESLMFAKYMMMRNVYWHHTVRAFSTMLKRFIQDALDESQLEPAALRSIFYSASDERLLFDLRAAIPSRHTALLALIDALIERRPYKRTITLNFHLNPDEMHALSFLSSDARRRKLKEHAICTLVAQKTQKTLTGNEVLIDAPSQKTIFDLHDFRELQLYRIKARTFVPFSESGVSAFQATLIESFERATKQLRVIARADVAADVKQLEHRIIEVLLSE